MCAVVSICSRIFLCCVESEESGGKSYGMVMGCIPEYGFNSGVILTDLDKIRKDDKWDALREHLAKHALSYFLPD